MTVYVWCAVYVVELVSMGCYVLVCVLVTCLCVERVSCGFLVKRVCIWYIDDMSMCSIEPSVLHNSTL